MEAGLSHSNLHPLFSPANLMSKEFVEAIIDGNWDVKVKFQASIVALAGGST